MTARRADASECASGARRPRRVAGRSLATAALVGVLMALPAAASAERAKRPWPPIPAQGLFFVHYGEEHWNDADGPVLFPQVIRETARYRPDLVTTSGDKDDDNAVENLSEWKRLMSVYDRRGIPYFAAVGNHDRARPGFQGVDPMGPIANYMQVFADRPYPFGDAPPIDHPLFVPKTRPAADPIGASSHYALSFGAVRWVFLDNSCFGITNCDSLQSPPFPDAAGNTGQFEFLDSHAALADARGQLLFVVMHMPTQDPRPGHTEPTPGPHTMGEGALSPDNLLFEQAAAEAGVDAVFLGHVKGQWHYQAQGIPYYTDGGAGGEVYVGPGEETGVDSGYWHGYRLLVVRSGQIVTDTVPIFSPGGITISGPSKVRRGVAAKFSAVGEQPTEFGPEVNALELREPDPTRPNAQNLPTPARIWRTGDPQILKPLAAPDDDARRDSTAETVSGRFRGRCPGKAEVRITSGWETETFPVLVPSRKGPLSEAINGGGSLEVGNREPVASVDLVQAARIRVTVRQAGELVRRLLYRCSGGENPLRAFWDGLANGEPVPSGLYTVSVQVLSDRPAVTRRFDLRVTD